MSGLIDVTHAVTGLPGATTPTRYVGGTTSGPPLSGTYAVGDWAIDTSGSIWIFTPTGWAGPTLTPAVTAPSVGPHWTIANQPKYWRSLQGEVTVVGMVSTNVAVATNDVIFTLASGYAPGSLIPVGGLNVAIDLAGNVKSAQGIAINTSCVLNVHFLAGV